MPRGKGKDADKDKRTREQRLIDANNDQEQLPAQLTYPPLEHPDLMIYIEMLFEAGPVLAGGFGAVGLTWSELSVWQQQTGIVLYPHERRLLHYLSQVYASATHSMGESDALAPWPNNDDQTLDARIENAQKTETAISMMFAALSKKPT